MPTVEWWTADGRWRPRLRGAASVTAGALLLAVILPRVSGTGWTQLQPVLAQVTPFQLLLLSGVWLGGLLMHTIALTAALPGLTHRRALTLSLTGSAVSNVTPLGGALGIGLNFHMTRVWGASRSQFVAFTFITNLWDVLVKLLVPVGIVAVLLTTGIPTGFPLRSAVLTSAMLLLATIAIGACVVSGRAATRTAAFVTSCVNAPLRLLGLRQRLDPGALLELRSASSETIRGRWQRLTLGQLGYTAMLFALLWCSLRVTHSGLSAPMLLAGFAVERLLSLSVLTPGGAGVVEVGLVGFLLIVGGSPTGTVAGVLLYRAFTFLIEIPVGGALLAGWWWAQRWTRAVPPSSPLGAAEHGLDNAHNRGWSDVREAV